MAFGCYRFAAFRLIGNWIKGIGTPWKRTAFGAINLGSTKNHGVEPVNDRTSAVGVGAQRSGHGHVPRFTAIGLHCLQIEALDVEDISEQSSIEHVA